MTGKKQKAGRGERMKRVTVVMPESLERGLLALAKGSDAVTTKAKTSRVAREVLTIHVEGGRELGYALIRKIAAVCGWADAVELRARIDREIEEGATHGEV